MTRLIQICVVLLVCVFVHGDIPDHTCFAAKPIRQLDGTDDNAFIGSYVGYVEDDEDLTTTFGRVVDTGSGDQLNPGIKSTFHLKNKVSAVLQYLSVTPGNHRVGAFFCNSTHLEDDPSYIPLIILGKGAYIKPEKRTQTVSFGETVTINMNLTNGQVTDLRWRLNEAIMESWSGTANVTIEHVTKDDAGIYECYLNNRRNEGKHAIIRLIVRDCSAARWGPDCQNLCPTCYNGGVCDDVTGLCICPPGFNTTDCSFGCGNNRWGRNCSIVCSTSNPGCRGKLACGPDPLGCSCMAGYGGLNCKKDCEEMGKYGSTCSEECHCADGVVCDPSAGCPNGPCVDGYSGKNCQVPDTCPDGRYGELCKYYCHCEDDGPCNRTTGSCGERKCRQLWIGKDCQLDGRTNVSLIIPESNVGAPVSITCIVQANPIPNEEDIQVLDINDIRLVGRESTVLEYTRTIIYNNVNVAKGDVFKCQVNSSSVAGKAHVNKNVTIYDPPKLTKAPQVVTSNTIITVTWEQWTDSVDDGDGPVIGYRVCYASTASSSLKCIESALNLTANFVIDSNDEFQRGLDYFFVVKAIRPGYRGVGAASQSTSVKIPCLPPKVMPSIVEVSSLGISEIQVQWQLIDTEHWRCNSLDSYEVEYKNTESSSFQLQNATSTATLVNISNLEPCTNYKIKVRATNSGGAGPSSDVVNVTTDVQEPGDIALTNNGNVISSPNSLTLNWNTPSNPECITSFNAEYTLIKFDQCNTSVTITESQQFSATATEGVLSNLLSHSLYRLSLYALYGNETTNSIVVEANTSSSRASGAPLAVSVQDPQQTELSFTWQPPECGKRNGPITKYKSRLKNSTSTETKQVSELSVTFSSLLPCTEYTFQVKALSGEFLGPWSDGLRVQTASQEPDSVKNVVITAASSRSLMVMWEAPDIHGCEIDFYEVEYQLENPGMCGENLGSVEGPLNTNSTSIEIDNLEVFSQYSVTIRAVIGQMRSNDNLEGPGTTSSGRTDEGEPTGKPLAVLNQVPQQTELSFTWQPPECGKRNGPITKYKSRLNNSTSTIDTKEVSELSVTFSSLPPCTKYNFQVKAKNGELFGPWSDVLRVQTASQEPDSVKDARITAASSRSLQVTWKAPDILGCEIDFYKVEYQLENPGMCGENLGSVEGPLNTTSTSIKIDNLKEFSQYSVRIRAVLGQVGGTDNIEGPETIVKGTTAEAEPIVGPWDIQTVVSQEATNDARGEIEISFGSVPCPERRGEILNYTVQVMNGVGDVLENTVTVVRSPATITGGFPCELVIPQVAACTSAGCGKFKEGSIIRMNLAAPGEVSVDVKSQPSQSKKLSISWSQPKPVYCPIVKYKIEYRLTHLDQCQEQNNEFEEFKVVDSTETQGILKGLKPFSTYEVVVSAGVDGMNGNTTFTPGQSGIGNTTSRVPEHGPKEVNVTSVSATAASFAWSQIECGYRNGHIRGYKFSLQNADSQELIKNNSETTELQCKVDDLKPYTKYIFSVRGFNSKGDGKISKELRIITEESFPSVVRNIEILNTDTKSFQIKWSRPEPPNGIVIGYQINYTEMDSFENNTWSVQYNVSDEKRETIDFNFIIENLQPNTNYSLQAAAFTSVGIGPWSDEIYVFTATGKPGPVHNLHVENASETDIYMTWQQPLNPNGDITNYSVQYRILKKIFEPYAELESLKRHSVGVNLTCLLSNLEPATIYEIGVFAKTSAGSGELTNINYTTHTPLVKNYPKLSVISQTDTTVKVKLEPIPNFIYVSKYVILVDEAAGAKRRNADGSHEYGRHEDSPNKYVTATFPRDNVPEEFTVGDNKIYGGYRNAPLVKDKTYGLSFAVDNGNNKYQTDRKGPKMITAGAPKPFKPEGSPVALIIGLVMFFLMAIVVLGMFLVIKRRRGGIRAKPMFPMSHITSEKRLTNAPSEDTLADTVSGKQPPISQKPANLKAARVHRPVKVEHLAAYVKKKRMHQNEGFQSDFESLPDQQMYSWDVAKKSENKTKNRYGNIIAYDHCRVVLEPVPGDPHSDYINACYIDGYNQKNAYIATQGPNTASVQDIWRMVWQEGCSVIVMVTNLSEGGKKKCEKYWPDNTQTYAGIDVKTIAEEDYPQYTVRTFKITKNDEVSREVKQFHFTVWPDMGVPEFANDILRFIDVVKENCSEKTGPTVVHCSAGVGRTGTLIAISEMLDMAREEGRINVFNFVHQMRTHRVKMVQTADQYFFIFDALLEAVVCGPTSAKAADMNSFYNNLLLLNPLTKRSYILEQYNALEAMSVVTTEENTKGGKMPDNISKNRFPEQVPIDGSRPYLMTLSSETGTNYINASFLHGYHGKDMYIATQMPMPNTVADFWCMVYDYKSKLILMLNEEASQDQTHGKYWPDSGCVQHGPMSIEHTSTVKSATAICRTFTLTNTLRMKEEPRQIKQYQYLGWLGSKTPASVESVLEFLKLLDGEGSENTDPPITVHCMNGIERCGLFCTIHSVFQRLQKEHIVDVFHTIRKLRRSRASMVAPVTQFEFCFTTVRCYLDAFEIYSNYK